jgi:hypothetical protein
MEKDTKFTCFYDDYWNCKLPVQGSENPSFINCGVEFGSFDQKDIFRDAKLPDGWRKIASSKPHWFNLVDNNKRIRAKIFEFDKPFMYLERRFSYSKEEEDIAVTFYVWDNDYEGAARSSIFRKRFVLPSKKRFKDAYNQKIKAYEQDNVCKKWLDETFPRWNDYNAYWGEGKVTIDTKTLKLGLVKNT